MRRAAEDTASTIDARTIEAPVPVADPIAEFYERHPYPPPVADVERFARGATLDARRVAHHLTWPERPVDDVGSVLVAGCGTSQAVRHALRRPDAHVVGIDVSAASVEATRRLADHHRVTNLEVRRLAIESVGELDATFDQIVCTGVLHHLHDPAGALAGLRDVLAPRGAITLMVYARYGRLGVYMFQDYCRRLGVTTTPDELADLTGTLREVPLGHPLSRLLRDAPDFADPDALADALCNPRDRSYTVDEFYDLLAGAGLRFGRWERQAPYLAECGAVASTPHGARIAARPAREQHALMELFRGTLDRHTVIAFADDDQRSGIVDVGAPEFRDWVPLRQTTALAVEDQARLPPGAAAALLNRAHASSDLVSFVTPDELATWQAIDGRRSVGELGVPSTLLDQWWRRDLVVFDGTVRTR